MITSAVLAICMHGTLVMDARASGGIPQELPITQPHPGDLNTVLSQFQGSPDYE